MKKSPLISSMEQEFDAIIQAWSTALELGWANSGQQVKSESLENHCSLILKSLIQVMPSFNPQQTKWLPPESSDLVNYLSDIGAIWAKKGLSSSETSKFLITLKNCLIDHLKKVHKDHNSMLVQDIIVVDQLLDRLLLICQESYSTNREKLIKQQNSALLEMSTPVVKMWDNILLLPLIGVIDTTRAKRVTESLLYEITKEEALVTVMDLTGVPIFDTAVAGHLMKTVSAAQMLGCQIIMTGISPEGALVLTKLGIEFNDVTTRSNLNAGVAEAFRMLGLRVKAVAEVH